MSTYFFPQNENSNIEPLFWVTFLWTYIYILVDNAAKSSLITIDGLCVGCWVSRPVLAAEGDVTILSVVGFVVVVVVVFVVVVRSAEQNKINCSWYTMIEIKKYIV